MSQEENEKKYLYFSCSTHFLDPIKSEQETSLEKDLSPYVNVLNIIDKKTGFTKIELDQLLTSHPEAIDLFEQILQLRHFTPAQWLYLLFDITKLNSNNLDEIQLYITDFLNNDENLNSFFKKRNIVEDPKHDDEPMDQTRKMEYIAKIKREIVWFVETLNKKTKIAKEVRSLMYDRIKNIESIRQRIIGYLLEERGLNDILSSIKPKVFLEKKRLQTDSKSSHGNYGASIVAQIIENAGFQYCKLPSNVEGSKIKRENIAQKILVTLSDFTYTDEKFVESTSNSRNAIQSLKESGKTTEKKFDFVLMYQGKPHVVIETNIYTGSGSKISVNEKEYKPLHENIAQNEGGLRFIWVTDGNFWVTPSGKSAYSRLEPTFGKDLMNYTILSKEIDEIKQNMIDSD